MRITATGHRAILMAYGQALIIDSQAVFLEKKLRNDSEMVNTLQPSILKTNSNTDEEKERKLLFLFRTL